MSARPGIHVEGEDAVRPGGVLVERVLSYTSVRLTLQTRTTNNILEILHAKICKHYIFPFMHARLGFLTRVLVSIKLWLVKCEIDTSNSLIT